MNYLERKILPFAYVPILIIVTCLMISPAYSEPPSDMKKYVTDKGDEAAKKEQAIKLAMDQGMMEQPGQYHMGNQMVMERFIQETQWYRDSQYQACNNSATDGTTHGHSYADIHNTPVAIYSDVCFEYHMYIGQGKVSGICKLGIPDDMCGCYWIYADAIDYLEPTQKITLSNQAFYSRYVDKGVFTFGSEMMKQMLEGLGAPLTFLTMMEVDRAAASLGNREPGGISNIPEKPDLKDYWMRSATRTFARLLPEYLVKADDKPWIPHVVMENPPRSMDVDWGMESYWLLMALGGRDHLAEPNKCLRNNMATGKTYTKDKKINVDGVEYEVSPENVDPSWTKKEVDDWYVPDSSEPGFAPGPITFKKLVCLEGVGEVDPGVAERRIHQTDAFYQAFTRGKKKYDQSIPPPSGGMGLGSSGSRQSFDLTRDRFHIIPAQIAGGQPYWGQKVVDDMGKGENQCLPFNEILTGSDTKTGRENHKWKTANTITPGEHGEVSVTLFTFFSGCVDFKGRDETYWQSQACPGSGVWRNDNYPQYPPSKWKSNQLRVR